MSSIRIEETTFYNVENAPDTPEIAEYDLIELFLICCVIISSIVYIKKKLINKYNKKNK